MGFEIVMGLSAIAGMAAMMGHANTARDNARCRELQHRPQQHYDTPGEAYMKQQMEMWKK